MGVATTRSLAELQAQCEKVGASYTLTMSREQEQGARAKAFYLLKKWTSFTFLNHAVRLYQDFLAAYAMQLNTPSPNQEDLET